MKKKEPEKPKQPLPKTITKNDIELLITCLDLAIREIRSKVVDTDLMTLALTKVIELRNLLDAITKLPFDLRLMRARAQRKKGA